MHTPRDRWIEGQRWFRWLDRRHYVHHVNVAREPELPAASLRSLFGTHRPRLHPAEAARVPSFEAARGITGGGGTGTEGASEAAG